jgi:hypothetical protein
VNGAARAALALICSKPSILYDLPAGCSPRFNAACLDDPEPFAPRQAGADGQYAKERSKQCVRLPEHEEDAGRTSGNIISSATADPIRLVQEELSVPSAASAY